MLGVVHVVSGNATVSLGAQGKAGREGRGNPRLHTQDRQLWGGGGVGSAR